MTRLEPDTLQLEPWLQRLEQPHTRLIFVLESHQNPAFETMKAFQATHAQRARKLRARSRVCVSRAPTVGVGVDSPPARARPHPLTVGFWLQRGVGLPGRPGAPGTPTLAAGQALQPPHPELLPAGRHCGGLRPQPRAEDGSRKDPAHAGGAQPSSLPCPRPRLPPAPSARDLRMTHPWVGVWSCNRVETTATPCTRTARTSLPSRRPACRRNT